MMYMIAQRVPTDVEAGHTTGVSWSTITQKWTATIRGDGKSHYLGCFVKEPEFYLLFYSPLTMTIVLEGKVSILFHYFPRRTLKHCNESEAEEAVKAAADARRRGILDAHVSNIGICARSEAVRRWVCSLLRRFVLLGLLRYMIGAAWHG